MTDSQPQSWLSLRLWEVELGNGGDLGLRRQVDLGGTAAGAPPGSLCSGTGRYAPGGRRVQDRYAQGAVERPASFGIAIVEAAYCIRPYLSEFFIMEPSDHPLLQNWHPDDFCRGSRTSRR